MPLAWVILIYESQGGMSLSSLMSYTVTPGLSISEYVPAGITLVGRGVGVGMSLVGISIIIYVPVGVAMGAIGGFRGVSTFMGMLFGVSAGIHVSRVKPA